MKQVFKSALSVVAGVAAMASVAAVMSTSASAANHKMYSLEDINKGVLGDKIVFNSIAITGNHETKTGGDYTWYKNTYKQDLPVGMLKNESNFVGARVADGQNRGKYNVWKDEVDVEDGQTYIVRIYVHNNNPNGRDAVAEGVKARFFIPQLSSTSQTVNGWITSTNAGEYVDDVVFKSDIPFHLEYVDGSALLENGNGGFASGAGKSLSSSVISDGAMIGFDGFDGKIPGCYTYVNYVTIEVKAVFDYDYTVEKLARIVGDEDKTWKKTVEAKVGDKVEFQIQYINTSDKKQENVAVQDILPSNLRYVPGSTKIYNDSHAGAIVNSDAIINGGFFIGHYGPDANAYIRFVAEVVDDNLACGSNTLVNWGRVGVGDKVIQDYARVHLDKFCEVPDEPENPTPTPDDPTPTPDPINELPTAGPSAVAGGVIATGSIVTAAGYYIASRRSLR